LNKAAVFEYLMYQSVYAPQTIVENIYQLPAGSYGVFKDSTFAVKPFWQIENSNCSVPNDSKAIQREVRDLFLRSVERRMISDVPLGAFLSGGIDSSSVVAMMSEVSEQPVNTFSITFDEKEFDESPYSELVAEKFNTRHSSVRLTANDFLNELPNALKAADSPSGDGLNTYVVSKVTKRSGITVALSGLGGDELFAGYGYFRRWLDLKNGLIPKMPALVRRPAAAVLAATSGSKFQRMADILSADTIDLAAVYPRTRQVMSESIAKEYGKNGNGRDLIQKTLEERSLRIEKFPLLSQFSIGELLGYTQNVLLKDTDQFSMASALEVREPFFDYHLVEYVLNIPDEFKLSARPKSLLVEALGDMLPPEIVDRPKMGFVLPFENWMRNELNDFCSSRINTLAERGLFNADKLSAKWRLFQKGSSKVRWTELWHLIVLTEWLENNKF